MPNANLNRPFSHVLLALAICFAACSKPPASKEDRIEEALALSAEGQHASAIAALEAIGTEFPNDPSVLGAIGDVYTADKDYSMASWYLEQAHVQNPQSAETLLKAYHAVEAANQPSETLLSKLADTYPELLTPELWIRRAQQLQSAGDPNAALKAYLKGVDTNNEAAISTNVALEIGNLYQQQGNASQARRWFRLAGSRSASQSESALLKLVDMDRNLADWTSLEDTLDQLTKRFPTSANNPRVRDARSAIARARAAEAEAQRQAEATAASISEAENKSGESTEDRQAARGTSGKAQVIDDIRIAERIAETPAVDPSADLGRNAITFNPNILIEPADPAVPFSVEFDQAATAPPTSVRVERTPPSRVSAPAPAPQVTTVRQPTPLFRSPSSATVSNSPTTSNPIAAPALRITEVPPGSRPSITINRALGTTPSSNSFKPTNDIRTQSATDIRAQRPTAPITRSQDRPATFDELVDEAESERQQQNFKSAIRKYWAAIGIDNRRSDVWNRLSRTYLADNQLENAQTSALEAVRLSPGEVAYTLDYLRVTQRAKAPSQFMRELETAHDRFPNNPEITLSLARAHERISRAPVTARNYYERFIQMAPNHPLIPEAELALSRLR